ncbi:MAG TPA: carbamoyltransferase HypF, partial [Chloroflexi bacterium]|nr:carbamoyltransferase HypF [Chloroflexota bacterium]
EFPAPQPLSLRERGEGVRDDPLTDAARALLSGGIIAIKGLGGFHIACDARNAAAVRVLRERKPRPRKPLAVMMRDMDMVRAFCEVSPEEARLLTSPAAPIVLLEPRPDTPIAPEVAPGQRALGVMLPYTPLHHILLREVNCPLVMTSGNRQNEPIARTNAEARAALTPIVDGFLWHDREIHNRNDDSVWMVAADGPVPVRRSRGYAPRPLALPWEASRPVLAAGSQMKNTFCLLTGNQAFLSQHIGEMDYLQTWEFFTESVRRYRDLFGIRPQVLAHDLHPDFTLAALDALHTLAADARPVPVQHHHAHIAACMAENGVDTPVIGVALDGTGYGPDGTIWGGEILIADFSDYERAARLEVFPLPGGERAIREPLRTAFGLLLASFESLPPRLDFAARLGPQVRRAIRRQIERRLNTPLTSSCGRLFDAVSALLGICERVTYEGQAAIEMETLAAQVPEAAPYPLGLERVNGLWQMPSRALFRAVTEDMLRGTDVPLIAARFHQSVIASVRRAVLEISRARGLDAVALSGGCFQNRILLDGLTRSLRADGLTVYTHHQVPPNDGGISLGQAVIAADLAPTPHPVSPPRGDGDR